MFVGIGTSFGRKCYFAYSKEHNKVSANSNVEFDETFFPMRTKGRRDYGILVEQEQHGHEVSTETKAADNLLHIINRLRVENPTWNPKDIYATLIDRAYQCALDEQTTKLYNQNGHTQTDITTSSTPSPSAGTKAKILEDINDYDGEGVPINDKDILEDINDNDGEGVPINDKDIVLTNNWEEYGDILFDKVSDKQLVAYIMGKDLHMYIPDAYHPKYNVNWKFMLTGYELSRRNDTIASMKIIGSYSAYDGKGDGLDRNSINVSQGKINLRQIIQDMEKGTVTINQEKYANDVLHRINMQEAKPVSTPCEAGLHLSGDDCPSKDKRDPEVMKDYIACVGSLMYLSVLTRGDCSFTINQTACFLNNPGTTHISDVKRILRLWKIDGSDQLSDNFTKTLPRASFERQ